MIKHNKILLVHVNQNNKSNIIKILIGHASKFYKILIIQETHCS